MQFAKYGLGALLVLALVGAAPSIASAAARRPTTPPPVAPALGGPRTVSTINGAGPHDWPLAQGQIRAFEPGVLQDADSYLTSWWGGRTVRFANVGGWTSASAHHAGWRIFLTRRGLGDAVIGYHSVDRYGPYAMVSVTSARALGAPVSMAVSHELNEMMIDPYVNVATNDGFEIEVVDPVADVFAVMRGVAVADFTTPDWYAWDSAGPWDAASALAGDHSTTPGGYAPTAFLKIPERAPAHPRQVTLRCGDA